MNSRREFLQKTLFASPLLASPNSFVTLFNNELPNILLLGDSISIGYTPFVRELLNGKANVFRPMKDNGKPENCQGTTSGVKNIDRWLGQKKWDIIHFNFGLHDIKHVDPATGKNSQNPKHPQQADPGQYKKNLEIIVEKLKTTGAKLIFATTTPYPDVVNGSRKPGMPKKYNKVAVKIMNKNGIAINNLYAFMIPRMNDLQLPNNVHFTEEGSRALAQKVTERINEMLDNMR
ncbi:acyl-CoA thioesterase-1 [Mariniphaga anaerophila]|uniref:Acyl-CoA thioesterase-1 n=1 Tax=Mariniphaga anaerophila TaxID=1484053 RepID=A0A1M4W5S4_9BACT|nr:SGNH/GDSL hydrolase family protein [Mariniphaga anaerophila]SHE76611.1 acyl-CoA thioesterase-1 [Mariniphaga anaerophila]